MKRAVLLIAVLVGAVVFTGVASGPANAATKCRDRIYDDWYHDGQIASTYPISCYRDALKHIPPDAKIYSSLETDIKAALQAALQRRRGKDVPAQVGHGLDGKSHGGTEAASITLPARRLSDGPGGKSAASATGSSGFFARTPLPILVLGGIALALIAAGGIGTGVRHMRARGR